MALQRPLITQDPLLKSRLKHSLLYNFQRPESLPRKTWWNLNNSQNRLCSMNLKSSLKHNLPTNLLSKNEEWTTQIYLGTKQWNWLARSISFSSMGTKFLISWNTHCHTIQQLTEMKLPPTTITGVKTESDVLGAKSWRRSTHARSASLPKDITSVVTLSKRSPRMSRSTKTHTVKCLPLHPKWLCPRPHLSFLHSKNSNSVPMISIKWNKTFCRSNYCAPSVKLDTRNCARRESAPSIKSRKRRC